MKILACRCEDVTLHELDAAIDAGHHDLESLKRYTGFGTGWCQGKGCLATCSARLAERGGDVHVPFTPRPPYHPIELGLLAGLPDDARGDAGGLDASVVGPNAPSAHEGLRGARGPSER